MVRHRSFVGGVFGNKKKKVAMLRFCRFIGRSLDGEDR